MKKGDVLTFIVVGVCCVLLFLILRKCLRKKKIYVKEPFGNIWKQRPEEYQVLLQMIKDMDKILNKLGIPYMAMYGTLIGVERHGGLIPWDDDVDMVAPQELLQKIIDNKEMFEEYNMGVSIYSKHTVKLYSLSYPKIGKYDWSWPFIDIFGYEVDGIKVIIPEYGEVYSIVDFLPSKQARFEGTGIIPIPNRPRAILNQIYPGWSDTCISSSYCHQYEVDIINVEKADCKNLK